MNDETEIDLSLDKEAAPPKHRRGAMVCSFCGKDHSEVKKLIAGPYVFICDECVDLCVDIIKEDEPCEAKK